MTINKTLNFNKNGDTFTPIEGQTYETMTPIDTAIGINNTADLIKALNVSTHNDFNINRDTRKDAILDPARTERFIRSALLQFGLEKTKIDSYGINNIIKNNDKADIGNRNVGITEKELVTILSALETTIEKNVFDTVGKKTIKNSKIVVKSPVPQEVIDKYGLDNSTGFYDKMVIASGIPIFASDKTTDEQIIKAGDVVNKALRNTPKIKQSFIDRDQKVILVAGGELGTVPGLNPATDYYSAVAHIEGSTEVGVHATAPSSNTNNSNVLLHELMGHGSIVALRGDIDGTEVLDPDFQKKLTALYEAEKSKFSPGKYYASANKGEFWAEIVAVYFGGMALKGDFEQNTLQGKDALKKFSPAAYKLVNEYFGENSIY